MLYIKKLLPLFSRIFNRNIKYIKLCHLRLNSIEVVIALLLYNSNIYINNSNSVM